MKKLDPRLKRTRERIMSSFLKLIEISDFNHITIADITKEAEINRSTFYYHFADKYQLMDSIQEEVLTKEIFNKLALQKEMNEQTIIMAMQAIISSQTNLELYCQKAYDEFKPKVDQEIKKSLMEILLNILNHERGVNKEHDLLATFWSGGIYEVAMACVEGKESLGAAVNRLNKLILTQPRFNE